MAKTVAEIAQIGGQTAEQLLKQLEAAGVKAKSADSELSSADSTKLRDYLKQQRLAGTIKLNGGGSKPALSLRTSSTTVQVKRKRSFDRAAVLAKEAQEVKQQELERQRARETLARRAAEEQQRQEQLAAEQALEQQKLEQQQLEQQRSEELAAQKQAAENTKPASKATAQTTAQTASDDGDDSKKTKAKPSGAKGKVAAKRSVARASKAKKGAVDVSAKNWQMEDDDTPQVLAGGRKKVGAATRQKIVKLSNKHSFQKPVNETKAKLLRFRGESMELAVIARELALKGSDLVRALFKLGVSATVNSSIDFDTCSLLLAELGHDIEQVSETAGLQQLVDYSQFEQQARPAVITIMGHVDHGKTTLLDYLRKSQIAAGEQGGITQHIGAYKVKTKQGELTFLDTPGHAAFFNMRARGAQITDVVVLVVAADDGVNQQTIEAIQHIRSAGCPLVVAINKIDKDNIDVERVRTELSEQDIVSEQWGGDVPFAQISAKTGQGIDELLETIVLQAELLELKAARQAPAQGVVLESSINAGQGASATMLVNNGELRKGDIVVSGSCYGRIRTMVDEHNQQLTLAAPATPVKITGISGVIDSGELFQVVDSDKQARELVAQAASAGATPADTAQATDPFASLQDDSSQLNLVIKADVHGSLEAICATLQGMGNEQVKLQIVGSGVGGIVESDVLLAKNTQALLIGFNVRPDVRARKLLQAENIQPFYYSIIYELFEQIEKSLKKLQAPEYTEQILGLATVREVFDSTKFGQVAGCLVVEGTIHRSKKIRVLRNNVVIFEGELDSLRRFRDDVREVRSGTECGLGVRNYKDIKVGDQIEVFDLISNQAGD